jgi:hypothetical protein
MTVRFVAVLVLSSRHTMLYQYRILQRVPYAATLTSVIESHSPIQRSMTNYFKEAFLNTRCRDNDAMVQQSKDCAIFLNLK